MCPIQSNSQCYKFSKTSLLGKNFIVEKEKLNKRGGDTNAGFNSLLLKIRKTSSG